MRYYAVTMPKAHCGFDHRNTTICFYFEARDALSAMDKAKRMPGCKHSLMAYRCVEITKEQYECGRQESAYKYWKKG